MKCLPKKGDIWRDDRGPFLVLEENDLNGWDQRNGYVCDIDVLDLITRERTEKWTVSDVMLREMTFVA